MAYGKKEGVLKVLDRSPPTVPLHEVMHVFYVALLCVEEQAIEQLTMCEVVQILTELPKPPNAKPGDSTVTESPPPTSSFESPAVDAKSHNHQPPQSPLTPPDLLSIRPEHSVGIERNTVGQISGAGEGNWIS